MATEYTEVEAAIESKGLRLVLTTGVPGPWGESAKGILAVKGIEYVAVRQTAATADPKLIEWTRQSSAPAAMFDDVENLWKEHGLDSELHMERFTIAATDKGGEGGTVTFAISDKQVEIDGATTLLEAGEQVGIQMPFGCRMGICQTCVLPLDGGNVRDIRSGDEHGAGDRIQTCISTAPGDCTINI